VRHGELSSCLAQELHPLLLRTPVLEFTQEMFMEIGIYVPPRDSPSPPPPPPRKYRSAIIMAAIFIGGFLVSLAVFGRHELAAMFAHRAVSKPAIAENHFPVPPPVPKAHDAAAGKQPRPAEPQQAYAMPPSVFQ
jgi:hypothetical protein